MGDSSKEKHRKSVFRLPKLGTKLVSAVLVAAGLLAVAAAPASPASSDGIHAFVRTGEVFMVLDQGADGHAVGDVVEMKIGDRSYSGRVRGTVEVRRVLGLRIEVEETE